MLTPRRHGGPEILDQRDVPLQLRTRSHRDIALANRLFGGTRALLTALGECAHALPRAASFLEEWFPGDEAALVAFEQWSTEQGIDLSGVRAGA